MWTFFLITENIWLSPGNLVKVIQDISSFLFYLNYITDSDAAYDNQLNFKAYLNYTSLTYHSLILWVYLLVIEDTGLAYDPRVPVAFQYKGSSKNSWSDLSGVKSGLWYRIIGPPFGLPIPFNLVVLSSGFLSAGLIMSSDTLCTVLFDVPGFPAWVNRNAIATAIKSRLASLEVTAVQLVGNMADTAGKQLILRNESIVIGDIVCPVLCGHAPKKFNNFPLEADDGLLTRAINKFQKAKDIYNPCWLHLSGVADSVMVVSMVRHQAISRNVKVEGFWVKASY